MIAKALLIQIVVAIANGMPSSYNWPSYEASHCAHDHDSRPLINVTTHSDYPILPANSGATNTANINAILSSPATTTGSRLYFPAGTYNFQGRIQVARKDDICFYGDGYDSTYLVAIPLPGQPSPDHLFACGNDSGTKTEGMIIHDLHMTTSATGQFAPQLVWGVANWMKIFDCRLSNATGFAISIAGSNNRIAANVFSNLYRDGVHVLYGHNNMIMFNHFEETADDAIGVTNYDQNNANNQYYIASPTGLTNLTIYGNVIYYSRRRGIIIEGKGGQNIEITNNIIGYTQSFSLLIHNGANYGPPSDGDSESVFTNVGIYNNTFTEAGSIDTGPVWGSPPPGADIHADAVAINHVANCVLSGNDIANAQRWLVNIGHFNGLTITDNAMWGSGMNNANWGGDGAAYSF